MSCFLPSLRHLWLLAACALIWLAALGSGVAQGTATSDSFSSRTAIELRIDSARKELADLPASADPALRGRLQQLEAATDSHLATIDLLAGAQDRLTKAKAEASAWNGFPTAPPYSVLLLDQTRESLAGYESERDIAKAQLDVVRVDLETLRDALVRHQQNERRLRELASGAAAPDARFTANTQAQIESLDARIAAERIGRNQLAAYAMQARIDAAAALI
jgi:hypothetical protein